MAEGKVPPLVLGEGSPKPAQVAPGVIGGHICVMGNAAPAATVLADVSKWAANLGAGTIVVDLEGHLSALMVERRDRGALDDIDLRILTPSSPVGIPVAFKPLSGLSSAPHTEPWKRLRGWLPQLLATLAGMGPDTPDHDKVAAYFLRMMDETKANNPSILTVQGLVEAVREGLSAGDAPITPEVAQGLLVDLTDMAEDLRNAALSYGAPMDLPRLLDTPVGCADKPEGPDRHIDVVLLSHMTSVADRNSIITALLLEVFSWCRLRGKTERLLVVVPEVESPAAFLDTRPFAQRLTQRVFATSKGTGLLGVSLPSSLTDPPALPRFGAIMLEKARYDVEPEATEGMLRDQGMEASGYARVSMLHPDEWALAAGTGWTKWHRFTPDAAAAQERQMDTDALARLLTPEVRDGFSHKPEPEEECAEGEGEGEEPGTREVEEETARAALVVEDAEDLLSYTTEKKTKRSESKMHQEVQELLKRKLEEKERAKEAQKFELSEIDLVEGEEPSDLEMSAHTPRPLSEGVIDDHRDKSAEATAPGMQLHSDDLQVELAVLEAQEAEAARKDRVERGPDVVVDLEGPQEGGWESVSPEIGLGAETDPKERSGRAEGDEEEEEEIIVELDDDEQG